MKIIIDKIEGSPPHALTRQDIKAVLSVLPKEWDFPLPVVHLKATIVPNVYDCVRYDYLAGPKLSVCCRGMDRIAVFQAILRELAIEGLRKSVRRGHRLSQAEWDEIDRIIRPLLEQVETALAERKPPARETSKDHGIYQRLAQCGYTWKEAYQVVLAIESEKHHPTSRTTGNRIKRARQVLAEAGIDLDTMTVNPAGGTKSEAGER